jgi:hypothetical protein
MKTRWFFFGAFALGLVALGLGYSYASGRLEFLTLDNHAKIDSNGAPVQGQFLEGHRHTTALVTISEAGKEQTYQLFFEGDTDRTGEMGSVSDCGTWVAPRLAWLLEMRNYPPCKHFLRSGTRRWSLFDKGDSMEFLLPDQSKVRIHR